MYLRLMLRGILRHRKKGRRLFILIALSTAGVVFLLTFRSSFGEAYRDLAIGAMSGHLQIVSPDSPQLKPDQLIVREGLPLIEVDRETEDFVRSLAEVEASGRIIETWGSQYSLDGENLDGSHLVALPAALRRSLYPAAALMEGSDDIAWDPSMADVPLARPRLASEYGQVNPDHSVWKAKELRVSGEGLEAFKKRLAADFPAFFARDYAGSAGDEAFFKDWGATLTRGDLAKSAPSREAYDWRLDDALAALEENRDPARLPFLNKRLYKALYDEAIGPIPEPILVGDRVTLHVPPAVTKGDRSASVIMPVKLTGFVDYMPLYGMAQNAFMELAALQRAMGLGPDSCVSYLIRLKDIRDAPRVKSAIEAHLRGRGLPYVVADYKLLGKLYEPTTMAIGAISAVLSFVLAAIVVILVVNMVMLSVIKRRREMGTAIALGLSPGQNVAVMLGETAAIVGLSWLAGCLIGGGLVAVGAFAGIPGMFFFPGGKLFLEADLWSFLGSFAIIVPISVLAAFLPLLPLRRTMPVELLKEESR